MEINHIKTVTEIDEETYVGLYEYSIFDYFSEKINIQDILNSNILSEEKFPEDFGPLKIETLNETDFEKIDFSKLKFYLNEYYKDKEWGEDLPIFKNFVNKSFGILNIDEDEIYYINMDNVRPNIKPIPQFWGYFIGLICINRKQKRIVKLYFGQD